MTVSKIQFQEVAPTTRSPTLTKHKMAETTPSLPSPILSRRPTCQIKFPSSRSQPLFLSRPIIVRRIGLSNLGVEGPPETRRPARPRKFQSPVHLPTGWLCRRGSTTSPSMSRECIKQQDHFHGSKDVENEPPAPAFHINLSIRSGLKWKEDLKCSAGKRRREGGFNFPLHYPTPPPDPRRTDRIISFLLPSHILMRIGRRHT